MKSFIDSLDKASKDAARHMQRDLRRQARAHGWNSDVIKNTFVEYDGETYKVKVPGSHADQAFVHEFGSPESRPTATIRKYDNSNGAERALYKSMSKRGK